MIVGIDLGTTNSLIGAMDSGISGVVCRSGWAQADALGGVFS